MTSSKLRLLVFALACGLPVTTLAAFSYGVLLLLIFDITNWLSIENAFVVAAAAIATFNLYQFWKLVVRTVKSEPFEFEHGYKLAVISGVFSMLPLLFIAPLLLLAVVPLVYCASKFIQIQLELFGNSSTTRTLHDN